MGLPDDTTLLIWVTPEEIPVAAPSFGAAVKDKAMAIMVVAICEVLRLGFINIGLKLRLRGGLKPVPPIAVKCILQAIYR